MDNFIFNRPELQPLHKLRTIDPDVYYQVLKTHLSYLMDDLPPDCLTPSHFVKFEPATRRPKRLRMGSSSRHTSNGIMGAPLTQEGICRIHQLIEYIGRKENICQKNLFRRPGTRGRQDNLRFKVNSGAPLDIDLEDITVYDCCEVLKKFLLELSEPLLTKEVYEIFRLIPDMSKGTMSISTRRRTRTRQLGAARLLLLFLPTESFLLLHNILTLMTNIIDHKEDNLMDTDSLSVLFTPSVVLPRKLTGNEMTEELPVATRVMSLLIESMPFLFEPLPQMLHDVKLRLKKYEEGNLGADLAVPSTITFCDHAESASSEDYTKLQLQNLALNMNAMPHCSQKALFFERLNQQDNKLTPDLADTTLLSHTAGVGRCIRKYFAKSFKRKNLFQGDVNCDRLSRSMVDPKTTSPVLLVAKKKSSHH